ncbi:MAG TPA: hypothetical protein VHG91_12200, partial [Longimicrobium sp.]|nr:hypothetical protein [Longimicrobium sp.]
MNVRPLRRTGAALALALLLGACRGEETPRAPLAEGDAAPGAWGERGGVLVAWALKSDGCRGCGRPAAALRRLQAEHGDRVRLSALAVGGDGGA